MTERDLGLVEALAGNLLSTLGYGRAAHISSIETAAVGKRCQTWWEYEMAYRAYKGQPLIESGCISTREAHIMHFTRMLRG